MLLFDMSPYRPLPGDKPIADQSARTKEARVGPGKTKPCATDKAVANLPFAHGRSFCRLDDYLAHLERQGAIDLPYWRPLRGDLYERVKRMSGATREIATRAELMKRFGFTQ